jgi:hypothetical protein
MMRDMRKFSSLAIPTGWFISGGASANCVTLRLTVGDPSGSESERWNLDVFEEGAGRAVCHHCDNGFGTPGSAEYSLVKGKAYTFSLRWVATNLDEGPDYDWQAKINDSTEAGAYSGLYGTGAFIVEDPCGLLTECTYGGPNNLTVGKQGRIIVPKVDLEIDNVSEDDEESVGGFVPVNADNDNGSAVTYHIPATRDFDANGYTDDDLVPVSLRLEPATGLSGTLRLRKVEGGRDRIRVWETAGKVTEVTLPKTWTVGTDTIPATLQVEGLKEGAALRDVALVLEYLQDGTVICGDTVKITVTPVLGNLVAVGCINVPDYYVGIDALEMLWSNGGWGVPTVSMKSSVWNIKNPNGKLCVVQHVNNQGLLTDGAGAINSNGDKWKWDFRPPYGGATLVDGFGTGASWNPLYEDLDESAILFESCDTPRIWVGPDEILPASDKSTDIDIKQNFTLYAVWQFSDGTVYFLANTTWNVRYQGVLTNTAGTIAFSGGADNKVTGSSGLIRDNANQNTSEPGATDAAAPWRWP